MDRREFLKSATAGFFFCGCTRSARAQPATRTTLTVDTHAHYFASDDWPLIQDRPEAQDLPRIMNAPFFSNLTSVDARIEEMDRQGIDVQAVSLYIGQYHYWAERELSEKLVRAQNEKLAEVCAMHPERFVGLGGVSLHFPELAAEQMAHAVKEYDFRGFMITGSVDGEEISAPRFDPFWKKAEELDTLIFIHPRGFAEGSQRFEGHGWLSNTIGNPLETTTALSHMIFDGFLDRFPSLKILAAHGGGYLPTYIGRSDNCHDFDPRCQHMKKRPSEYLKQLYFDTLVYSPEILRNLIDQVGAERIVMGTDFPFPVASRDPLGDVGAVAGLSEAEKQAIVGATAARILKIR